MVKSPSIKDFCNCCFQVILGVSRTRQCKEQITSKELASWLENMANE